MSNLQNAYANLSDFKSYAVPRGHASEPDVTDDDVIQDLLNAASRYIDAETRKIFYPQYQSVLFDIPDGNILYLDDDLLEITELLNGDDTVIASSAYILQGRTPPYWKLSLRSNSTVTWEDDASGNAQQVIDLRGFWGRHEKYSVAWEQVGTLSAAITDTTTLAFSATSGHSIVAGNILKIGTELYNVVTAATNVITPIRRGDNGSTAATHLISVPIYAWRPMEGARMSTLEIANSAYKRRFGQSTGDSATITAAGVVLTPRDIPATAQAFIQSQVTLV